MTCQIIKKICPAGLGNNPNNGLRSLDYITVHCTGNHSPTAGAKAHAEYLYGGSGGSQMSWHYTADKDEIYQSFEDHQACWHAGDGSGNGNMTSIGIEICVNDRAGFPSACENAARLAAELIKKHGLSLDRIVQHNRWSGKDCPKELRSGAWGVTWDGFIATVKKYLTPSEVSQPAGALSHFINLSEADAAERILEMVKPNALSAGIFPSVKAAQLILESGYLKSELAQSAYNGFGMKKNLSGNAWLGSTWDGSSIYTKKTQEQGDDGTPYTVTADFRKYARIEDSIADHSAYLLGAKNGNALRYAGITEAANYKDQIAIIKNGGYATDSKYVSKVCGIITRFNLDRYDKELIAADAASSVTTEATVDNAIADGVLIDRIHWLGVLSGTIKPNPEHIKLVFDRYHAKLT